jgi:hypothetical protein
MSTVAPERCTKRRALRSRTGGANNESRQPNGLRQPRLEEEMVDKRESIEVILTRKIAPIQPSAARFVGPKREEKQRLLALLICLACNRCDDIIDTHIAKQFITLLSVVAKTRAKLIDKAKCVHNTHFLKQDLNGGCCYFR